MQAKPRVDTSCIVYGQHNTCSWKFIFMILPSLVPRSVWEWDCTCELHEWIFVVEEIPMAQQWFPIDGLTMWPLQRNNHNCSCVKGHENYIYLSVTSTSPCVKGHDVGIHFSWYSSPLHPLQRKQLVIEFPTSVLKIHNNHVYPPPSTTQTTRK